MSKPSRPKQPPAQAFLVACKPGCTATGKHVHVEVKGDPDKWITDFTKRVVVA